ncbi:hypothetical protein HY967_03695 [Candidatus Jorgensenbacteria bacterium]|nr:hypothetical protein [Candidatus Jorgensenbacteria bacterium]
MNLYRITYSTKIEDAIHEKFGQGGDEYQGEFSLKMSHTTEGSKIFRAENDKEALTSAREFLKSVGKVKEACVQMKVERGRIKRGKFVSDKTLLNERVDEVSESKKLK